MSPVVYRLADYALPNERNQILRLYREIFHMNFTADYDMWFCDERRKTIGVVAVEAESGRIIGHWALARFEAVIAGEPVGFRQSFGTMTDIEYRGRGIAVTLFQHLLQAAGDARFIIGFPNEASYGILLHRLGFVWKRDYHFVVLPRGICRFQYRRISSITDSQADVVSGQNRLLHSSEYIQWHYQRGNYDIWLSERDKLFISVKFMNKADILYWSYDVTGEELLDFASFLYASQNVEKVTTWNSNVFLEGFQREKRNYHMCIHYLDATPAQREKIGGDWFFYMGDCDLY